ncbi:unnamed protein product [Blepharisma stoltei]|uniref:Uncharacterized protein n=1 Tax=Blepharisma stoltei TaxID=1481888 RepID=A0AAU9KHH6_9CILI|nr:unnamed protein product [Blepharisma stoltei]
MDSVSSSDFIKKETLYKTNSVEVFKAVLKNTGQEIAVKKLKFLSLEELNATYKEAWTMEVLKHPNFVKLYGILREESEDRERFILLAMEYFPQGDLAKEIKRRIAAGNEYWTEEDLWNLFKSLIQAYSYLQKQRIAHRDIKPQNIFVGNDGTLKVADLGCALQREEQERTMASEHTIAGTPLYLSPKLRESYMGFHYGMNANSSKHDPFKSDVYSLGLTFLYMASLIDVTDLTDLKILKYKTAQRINELRYSQRLKDFLSYMLEYDEAKRPSFIKLEEVFSSSVEGNMQVQPKYKIRKIKAKQITDCRVLLNFYSIKAFCKVSYINTYLLSILQAINNAEPSSFVWFLMTCAKSLNFYIKIGTLSYICCACKSGNIDYLFICNYCGIQYFIHKACIDLQFTCLRCATSNVFKNEEISCQQQDQVAEIKENSEFEAKNDLPFGFCYQCKKQKTVFIYSPCNHQFCQKCLENHKKLRENICFGCPISTGGAYEKLICCFPSLRFIT